MYSKPVTLNVENDPTANLSTDAVAQWPVGSDKKPPSLTMGQGIARNALQGFVSPYALQDILPQGSVPQATVAAFNRYAPMGFGNQLQGVQDTAADVLTGNVPADRSIVDDYKSNRDIRRNSQMALAQHHPIASGIGELGGLIAQTPTYGYAATGLGDIGLSGLLGMANTAGDQSSTPINNPQYAQKILQGGLLGGAFGTARQLLGGVGDALEQNPALEASAEGLAEKTLNSLPVVGPIAGALLKSGVGREALKVIPPVLKAAANSSLGPSVSGRAAASMVGSMNDSQHDNNPYPIGANYLNSGIFTSYNNGLLTNVDDLNLARHYIETNVQLDPRTRAAQLSSLNTNGTFASDNIPQNIRQKALNQYLTQGPAP